MTLTVSELVQDDEIGAARAEQFQTRRPTVKAIEDLMFLAHPLLDHGFIRVVDYMGSDAAVVQAARVSYGRGTRQVSEDRALIRYLMRQAHSTPFEMCEIKLHVKLPIFVARQWIRHRMASVNEYSARYSILDKEFYIPDADNLAAQSSANRQGRGDILSGEEAAEVLRILTDDASRAYDNYALMINEDTELSAKDPQKLGLARELARINLTLNTYTQWYWKIDLHNLMHFLKLRADPHAQYEIRVYADAILEIMQKWVPISYEAFREYRLDGASLSRTAIHAIKRMISGDPIDEASSGMSAREWKELVAILGR